MATYPPYPTKQDQDQNFALFGVSGTLGTAYATAITIPITASDSGALNTNILGGTVTALTASTDYITYIDETTTTNVTYVGKATTGSAGSSAVWQLKKIDETGSGTTLVTFAGTTTSYNQIWDDRVSLGYG